MLYAAKGATEWMLAWDEAHTTGHHYPIPGYPRHLGKYTGEAWIDPCGALSASFQRADGTVDTFFVSEDGRYDLVGTEPRVTPFPDLTGRL